MEQRSKTQPCGWRCVAAGVHKLENLFPDDGRTEPPPPLVERIRELLNAASPEHQDETWLTADEQAALFREMRADEAAAKREDAHGHGTVTLQDLRDDKTKTPSAEKGKDRGIEKGEDRER